MQGETAPPAPVRNGGNSAPHLVVLGACLGILLGAVVLTPSDNELRLGPITLPGVCIFRHTTGIPCPGCGLTRSVVAAVHGDWNESYSYHRLGPLVVLVLTVQVIYRLAWLALPAYRRGLARTGRIVDSALIPLMVLLFINWIPTVVRALGLGG